MLIELEAMIKKEKVLWVLTFRESKPPLTEQKLKLNIILLKL